MPITDTEIAEIAEDIRYRVDLVWPMIVRDATEKRAAIDPANSRHEIQEFAVVQHGTIRAIDHTWGYMLGICKARQIRPAQLVPSTEVALQYLGHALNEYVTRRSSGATPFGTRDRIDRAGGEARAAVMKHIEVTAREARTGYAGGTPIFPQSEWPASWFEMSKRKAIAAAIFVLGVVVTLLAEKLADVLWP